MRLIPLNKGKNGKKTPKGYAIVDDEDFEKINKLNWHLNTFGYAARFEQRVKPNRFISMHRLIMGMPEEPIDHINRNKLDNRKKNLRIATPSLNCANKPKRNISRTPDSAFKGVSRQKPPPNRKRPWGVCLKYQGKMVYMGLYEKEIEAAYAHDFAAMMLYGEFACTNFKYRGQND